VPYRDSKLTRLLQESLGGNYKTALIACMSMHESVQEEIISTLKFATRVKTIKNQFKMNVKTSSAGLQLVIEVLKSDIEDLRRENARLRALLDKCEKELLACGSLELAKEVAVARAEKIVPHRRLEDFLENESFLRSMGINQEQLVLIKE
jgi:hypothetical protein